MCVCVSVSMCVCVSVSVCLCVFCVCVLCFVVVFMWSLASWWLCSSFGLEIGQLYWLRAIAKTGRFSRVRAHNCSTNQTAMIVQVCIGVYVGDIGALQSHEELKELDVIGVISVLVEDTKPLVFRNSSKRKKQQYHQRHQLLTFVCLLFNNTLLAFSLLPDFVSRFKQVPITDEESSDLLSFLPSCMEFIDGTLEQEGNVLIHWYCQRRQMDCLFCRPWNPPSSHHIHVSSSTASLSPICS